MGMMKKKKKWEQGKKIIQIQNIHTFNYFQGQIFIPFADRRRSLYWGGAGLDRPRTGPALRKQQTGWYHWLFQPLVGHTVHFVPGPVHGSEQYVHGSVRFVHGSARLVRGSELSVYCSVPIAYCLVRSVHGSVQIGHGSVHLVIDPA